MTKLPKHIQEVRDELLKNMCNWAVMGTVGDDPKLPYMKHAFNSGYLTAMKRVEKLVKALEFVASKHNMDFVDTYKRRIAAEALDTFRKDAE